MSDYGPTIRVGVLRGGPSYDYDMSLHSGAHVLKHLASEALNEKYTAHDILIDRDGLWFMGGVRVSPQEVSSRVDVIFNALHGKYGEDGKVQKVLDRYGLRYTGSDALGSALSMNKVVAKKAFEQHGFKTPLYVVLEKQDLRKEPLQAIVMRLFRSFHMPVVVKPASAGSSVGVSMVRTFPDYEKAIEKAFEYDDTVLIEQFVSGKEAVVGLVDHFRESDVYALPPLEIRLKSQAPVAGDTNEVEEIVPGNFTSEEKAQLEELARKAHKALGLKHYSRANFIVHPRHGIYLLEINTLPSLADTSHLPKALEAVGATMPQFIDHLITLALE